MRPDEKPTPSELISKLKRRQVSASVELARRLKSAQKAVAARIEALSDQAKAATSDAARKALYAQIDAIYNNYAAGIDEWMQDQVEQTAIEWNKQAKGDLKAAGATPGVMAFDRSRTKRYWELIHGKNAKYLAGVFTQQMASSDLKHLRSAFLDTFRQQTIEGWTAQETHKNLQEKWDRLAKNLRGDRFVDSAGRPWTNADYLNMLTRTTMQRVANESYVDGIVEEGYELVRIVDDGEPCQYCRAWGGVIVDISGKQKTKFPSLSQAYDGGWGHPNCGCRVEAMIPEIDGDEIDRQKAQPATDWSDPKQVQRYNDEIRIRGKIDSGMSKIDAERDLKRDKIKRELRFTGRRMDDAVDDLPDDVIDGMSASEIPRVELAKKGDASNSSRNSSLGGVLYLNKDSKPEDFRATFLGLQEKRAPVAPKPTGPEPLKVVRKTEPEKPTPKELVLEKQETPIPKNHIKDAISEVRAQGAGNEMFIVVKSDGSMIRHLSGSDGGVLPRELKVQGSTFVHQHPFGFARIQNPIHSYGTSLSPDDIRSASIVGFKEIQAVTPRRIYKLSPGADGWPPVDDIKKAQRSAVAKVRKSLAKHLESGRINRQHVVVLEQHLVNKLVAKRTGMQYTWDRVKL